MLDRARFAALWTRMHLLGDPAAVFESLTRAYAAPERAYHNAHHINDCLAQLDLERGASLRSDEVEMALWFHDAIYDTHAADNEARSAAWADGALAAAGADTDTRARIGALILATRHIDPPREREAQIIADVDLSILGRPPERFAEFERQIRREYAWVSEPEYRQARRKVLQRFLERPSLYQTEGFHRRYEVTARHNLRVAIASLTDR